MSTHDPLENVVHRIAHTDIDSRAIRRDRMALDRDALEELKASIKENGLRMPIEVFKKPETDPHDGTHALISGFRRYTAMCELYAEEKDILLYQIPAFVRPTQDHFEAFRSMIEENAVREDISPWEKGSAVLYAVEAGKFETIEEATNFLFPHASRQKRAKIRMIAKGVAEAKGLFRDPTEFSERQCVRLGSAIDAGFGEIIQATLSSCENPLPGQRWKLIEPYLNEAETLEFHQKPIGKKPVRMKEMKPGVLVRRAKTPEGWAIHFTGKNVNEADIEDAFVALKVVFEG